MRIVLAQLNPTVGDLSGNALKVIESIKQAKSEQADLVVFPELVICGYPPEDLLYKDHFIKDNLKALKDIGKKTKEITAIIGLVDQDKDKCIYNAAAVYTDGVLKGVYHKQELPNYGVFDEKRYFQKGKKDSCFMINGIKVGINICEDIWIDKGVYHRQSQKGAKFLINISSSPYNVGKFRQREKLITERAKQTKKYVCYVNLVGGQDELVFDGGSLCVNPKGQIVARAASFKEGFVCVDLELGKKGALKKKSIYHSKIKAGTQTERIYKALVLGVHDYIQKNGFQKVLIGLSGGIDSALVAAIAVAALGKKNVIGVSMPSKYNSQGTQDDAKQLAQNLGIEFKEIAIEGMVCSYEETLKEEFKGLPANFTEENIQARIRGNILMALSNKFGWLVLTTGNKSELAVGYCTLYGDMSGGFAVIKDVPKTKVYELANFINSQEKILIPQSIIDRAPSAELRENQKDQDSLPDYDVLDDILGSYIEDHKSIKTMSKKNKADIVKDVVRKVDLNEYKRRQAPVGIKITPRAFGRDWRLPITNNYKEL